MAEEIWMLFWVMSGVGRLMGVLEGVVINEGEGTVLEGWGCAIPVICYSCTRFNRRGATHSSQITLRTCYEIKAYCDTNNHQHIAQP